MSPALASLIALQQLDTAADLRRRRLAELPAAEQAIETSLAEAAANVDRAKAAAADNQQQRRALERDVAAVDTRLARFEDHKAAVKTNQEYTALLHEIATAKAEKDAIEDRILSLMETADMLGAELKAAESAAIDARRRSDEVRASLGTERTALDAEIASLMADRDRARQGVDARALATYEQLLRMRKGLAVAKAIDGHCAACHVRLRPNVEQAVRRNDSLVQCDSCQRLLYFEPPAPSQAAAVLGA